MKGSMGFGLPALQRQLERENRLNSLVQRVEWSSAAARAFEATERLKDWGGIHQAYKNIFPIMPALERQWAVVDSIAQSASVVMKAYPVDYISQIQGVVNQLYPAIENITMSRGIISECLKTYSLAQDMGAIRHAYKGIEFASQALKSFASYPVEPILGGIVSKALQWQDFGEIITVADAGLILDDIEEITYPLPESEENDFWNSAKHQFVVSIALAMISLLWGFYTYFFPIAAAKEEALSKAQLALDEKIATYLEMTAIAEERQADVLERIAKALEQKDEAEKTKELLENQLEEYQLLMERIEDSMLILNQFCQEADEGDSEEALIDEHPDHTAAQSE